MAKLSRMPLDLTLCANSNQLKLFSSSHLSHCLSTFNSDEFYCSERMMKNLRHDSKRCSKLPQSITFEVTLHKLFMKSNLKRLILPVMEKFKWSHYRKSMLSWTYTRTAKSKKKTSKLTKWPRTLLQPLRQSPSESPNIR